MCRGSTAPLGLTSADASAPPRRRSAPTRCRRRPAHRCGSSCSTSSPTSSPRCSGLPGRPRDRRRAPRVGRGDLRRDRRQRTVRVRAGVPRRAGRADSSAISSHARRWWCATAIASRSQPTTWCPTTWCALTDGDRVLCRHDVRREPRPARRHLDAHRRERARLHRLTATRCAPARSSSRARDVRW